MTSFSLSINRKYYQKECWLSYFDLLGFSDFVKKHNWEEIFSRYEQCLNEITLEDTRRQTLNCIWFSDSFIIFTNGNSIESFTSLKYFSLGFFNHLLKNKIPIRGALSFGEFYSDKSNGIYYGKSLIEAHEYGELQDWIGFILCPSVNERLKVLGEAPDKTLFKIHKIPTKKNKKLKENLLPAHMIGEYSKGNNKNPTLPSLVNMCNEIETKNIKIKYVRAIKFIKRNQFQ